MKEYKVGQILFMTNTKSFKVIPIQVVEEVVRTTIEGQLKTYMVMLPDKDKTVVDIAEVKSEIFQTEAQVKEYMIDNTSRAIEALILSANRMKNKCFGKVESTENELKNNYKEVVNHEHVGESETISVDLGNGSVAKMKVNDLRKVGNV
mgnify:CR=1 FL=1|tara:strand:- start:245 stop:691 length:447 start_codon:yes stop_codon:yes gene_type:complete